MPSASAVINTPIGPLGLLVEGGALSRIAFHADARDDSSRSGQDPLLVEAARQLEAYFDGRLTRFDLPLAPHGTPFQQAVWSALQTIPYGKTCSYAELAARIGRPSAVRAVGGANGRNPLPIVIPCHRVIGSNGKLVGFGGGLDIKRRLLAVEQYGVEKADMK